MGMGWKSPEWDVPLNNIRQYLMERHPLTWPEKLAEDVRQHNTSDTPRHWAPLRIMHGRAWANPTPFLQPDMTPVVVSKFRELLDKIQLSTSFIQGWNGEQKTKGQNGKEGSDFTSDDGDVDSDFRV